MQRTADLVRVFLDEFHPGELLMHCRSAANTTEFAHEDNCFLVRMAEIGPGLRPSNYAPAVDWGARPDTDHQGALIRFVYKERMVAQAKAKRAHGEAAASMELGHARQAISCIRELRCRPAH
jgi:hypothetical protein